ncbi:chemotaxis protein CheW [Thalassotalea sp. 1_MG-2023]|uniref:chemotaxis protein CheW n=1 Tax=Thalassotalea sp. 1_MG-2023 TaxID=3062680 RepID=UPI0026E3D0E3|nr:chemotaxis protein CheW [Thalassotalea sp. 1_MG-2023]MDO6427716.1 chemotaxis protein CheW [Thalassotalea sp. 1_MG-2023]
MNESQWISFEVASEQFLHPVSKIKEILPYDVPTPVPGALDITLGIQNIRGSIVSINSCRRMLHVDEENEGCESRIILVESEDQLVGIAVDFVGEIISAEQLDIDTTSTEIRSEYIKGTLNKSGKLYIVSDFSNVIEIYN